MTNSADSIFTKRPQGDAIHTWFSLSYSNYAVLPRTLLQSMPERWQKQFVQLLEELHTEYAHVDQADGYQVTPGSWLYANECTDAQLRLAGVRVVDPDPDEPDAGETLYVDRDGNETDGYAYVFVPGSEPIPHYNRGRAYLPPLSVLQELGMEPDADEVG